MINNNVDTYSKLVDYYAKISTEMIEIINVILSIVLNGNIDYKTIGFPVDYKTIGFPIDFKTIGITKLGSNSQNNNFYNIDKLDTNSSILDVGCGNADMLKMCQDLGYTDLTGIEISTLADAAKCKENLNIITDDFLKIYPKLLQSKKYDLVFAQAFVHLFPKNQLVDIVKKLLNLSKKRVYFSTTFHDYSTEGLEVKETHNINSSFTRYRSRYTKQEIEDYVRFILLTDSTLSARIFYITDNYSKKWINVIIDKIDINELYKSDNIIIYKGLYDSSVISNLSNEIDSYKTNIPLPNTIIRYKGENVFDRIENFVDYCSSSLRNVLLNEFIDEILEIITGKNMILLKDKINYKLQGTGKFVPHQDIVAGWDIYGSVHVNYSLAFDDCTKHNGLLYFSKGNYQNVLLSDMKTPMADSVVKSLNWTPCYMEKGDAIFFSSYIPHYSDQNDSNSSRRVSFLTFITATDNQSENSNIRNNFYANKIKKQPSLDTKIDLNKPMIRDVFGKLVYVLSDEKN